jgi:hypothetical protein
VIPGLRAAGIVGLALAVVMVAAIVVALVVR